MFTADDLIAALDLRPLPREGGYYRETYRAADRVGERSLCTAIYYLLIADTCSALHRLPSDEIFHFYVGDPVSMLQLWPDGTGRIVTMGVDVRADQAPQVVVPAGVWQGSWLAFGGRFALLGTTMAPGFEFSDYESGDCADLSRRYPAFRELIDKLTSEPADA
jgi:predicted cupin superfamily sugar epimerase